MDVGMLGWRDEWRVSQHEAREPAAAAGDDKAQGLRQHMEQ